MNISEFLGTLNVVDVLIILGLFGGFVLGYAQGAIRRVVGIATMTFSFFVAAQLSVPVGSFLAQHWTQFPPEYAAMLGFLMLFIAGVVAFALVVQGTYSKVEIFAQHPVVDEVVGGILGVIQVFLLVMFVTIILDQFFLSPAYEPNANEIPALANIWMAIDGSRIGQMLHETTIPNFLGLVQFLIPQGMLAIYGIR
ncbi:MAG TPA: CvpA family protein [Candidatus Limnocylindrales bacterium]